VGENDGVGRFSIQLASSLLGVITCKLTVVVNATIAVCIKKETAVTDALVRCQRERCASLYGHVFSFFSTAQQEAAEGPRQNGETGRSTGQRWEDLGGNTTTQTKTRSKWMRASLLRDENRPRASHWHQHIFDSTKSPIPPCGNSNPMRDVNEYRGRVSSRKH
jgi:hypothetical protein